MNGSFKLKGHFSRSTASITLEKSLELIFKSKFVTYVVLLDPWFTKTARINENIVGNLIVGASENSEQSVWVKINRMPKLLCSFLKTNKLINKTREQKQGTLLCKIFQVGGGATKSASTYEAKAFFTQLNETIVLLSHYNSLNLW